MNNHFRHGDLIIGVSKEDISNLKKIGERQFILAEGETTGHKHVITATQGTVDIYKDEKTNELVIIIDGKASIVHEEHNTIEIPSGIYRMKNQQEYNYFELNSQRVID